MPPPPWFDDELDRLVNVIRCAKAGELIRARAMLADVRGDDMREWYLEHGQNSGAYRYRQLGRPNAQAYSSAAELNKKASKRQEKEVLARDGHRCRYCGLRLISCDVLKAMERLLGSDVFPVTRKNASHGAALVFRCSVDHVWALNLGGTTTIENLVAACYSCNFGKWNYSLEQIGLDDPRLRPVFRSDDWDGLTSLMTGLEPA